MKTPRFFNKAVIAIGFKEPPRRRGLGKKNPLRIAEGERGKDAAATRSLVPYVANAKILSNGSTQISTRGYQEAAGQGGINEDWSISALTEDADVWQNAFLLRSRMRDLFRTDPYYTKWIEEAEANTFGADGITCRMRIKETEDRVVYAPDEKGVIDAFWRRRDRVSKYVERKYGRALETRANATIQVGDLDLYANKLIEDAWRDWKRREYCTVSGVLSYNEVCRIRLISAARDGDFFMRHVRDPAVNKYGYSLQLINSEWCDFFLNSKAGNGNEIRMGIERDKWGKRVAYYFITRQPFDWQFSVPSGFSQGNPKTYTRVPAEEIIHYARYKDGDSTRPAPWGVSNIIITRHLGKYQEAAVANARVAANKMGFFTSTLVPEGGMAVGDNPDPTKVNMLDCEPGSFHGLPWGVDFKDWNPQYPNQEFASFRKEMLRAWCAGLPGANYNIIANDLEGVNYSSGRLGMLDERELWKLIQKFDIEVAERPIFEAWLEMALMTGAIPLPLARFDKFNKPVFRGRRWAWVDPMKEVQANALQVANKFTSRTRVIEDSDVDADFEEVLFELAEEEMMMTELGMDPTPATGKGNPQQQKPGEEDGNESGNQEGPKKSEQEILEARIIEPEMTQKQLIETLLAIRASEQPAKSPDMHFHMPDSTLSVKEIKLPDAKAPVVHNHIAAPQVINQIKTPEMKPADVHVHNEVKPADVHVHNVIETPTTKKITVERDSDGKLKGIEVEKE